MEDLDTLVRRVDEDRWLASRFAPTPVRRRLIAIYAVNYEIARTAETVREAALGDIKLEWWRSALEEIAARRTARAHPALEALSGALSDRSNASVLQGIVASRAADFEAQPFATWAELEDYLDGTAGAVLRACLLECGVAAPDAFVAAAGRAWGYTGLLRAEAFWRAKGRSALPREDGGAAEMRGRAQANYDAARALASALPQAAFPAIGYLALAPGYLRALARGRNERGLFARQLSLIAASATGRI